jgi:hypothetical protein
MSYTAYQTRVAAESSTNERIDFIKQTYLHLGGAIIACVGLTTMLFNSEFGQRFAMSMAQNWLMVIVMFMVGGWVASKWAYSGGSAAKQYLGLGLYVVLEAFIFMPLLMVVKAKAAAQGVEVSSLIGSAGVITTITFGGLSLFALTSKKDFAFLGGMLRMLLFVAIGFVIASVVFGFSIGNFFAAAMVALMGGFVLYDTSNIMRRYPIGSHVAASLSLFATIATMFYYVLIMVTGRD